MKKEIKINDRTIGFNTKPYIIAELSGNHNRDIHIGQVFDDSAAVTTTNATGIRLTYEGYVGINEQYPYNGLTIQKEGNYWDTNGNTYAKPVGKVLSTWG